jgi:hypothetical protein
MPDDFDYPFTGFPVSIRVMRERHALVFIRVVHKRANAVDDAGFVGPDKLYRAGLHRLRALGGLAHDQNRFSQ